MQPVSSSLMLDFGLAMLFGALGGFALGLLQDKGLELPHVNKAHGVVFIDAGFLADVLVGLAAGALTYVVNPPSGQAQLFAATFTAGIGGSGILKGYIKGTAAREHADLAQSYRAVAIDAARGPNADVNHRLAQLHTKDQELRRRFGPR